MPQFILEIPNNEETISNPVATTVLSKIIRTFKSFPGFDFQFMNLGNSILVKGSEIDLVTTDRSQQRMDSDNSVFLEVTERYNEDMSRAQAIRERTQKNIFSCDKTKITMHPGYQQMIIDISMRFRFSTRHAAENFRKRVRLGFTKSVDGMKFEVKYNYTVPYQFLYILKEAHTLMENKHGYGIDFGKWLRESFTKNLTTLANQAGSKSVLAIAEINQNVLVLVQSPDDVPQKEKEEESDAWSITMEFEVMYDRPDVMRLFIPHVIHNQPIPYELVNRLRPQVSDEKVARAHMSILDAIQTGAIPIGAHELSGASSPTFDDWLPAYLIRSYPDLLRVLLLTDEDNHNNVLDLDKITDWEFTEATKNWLIDTRATIAKKNFNVLWFRLWDFDRCMSVDILELDENFQLTSKDALDPRRNYHLTVGLCIDPKLLDPSVWDDLKNHPDFLYEWINTIAPDLIPQIDIWIDEWNDKYKDTSEKPWHEGDNNGGGSWTDMPDWVIDKLKDQLEEWASKGIERFKMPTVMIYGVFARRRGVNYDA